MTFLDFLQSDWICPLLCLIFCLIHTIGQWIHAVKLGKKIDSVCEKCGSPVISDEEHTCSLSNTQLKALTAFVMALKEKEKSDNGK